MALHLSMPPALEKELRDVAAKQNPPTEAQELLRLAARAIIEAHHRFGEVPRDMAIVQRQWTGGLSIAAEEPGPFEGRAPPRLPSPPKNPPGQSLPETG